MNRSDSASDGAKFQLASLALAVGIALIIVFVHWLVVAHVFVSIWHWILTVTGNQVAGTRWNLAWSGFLSAGVITTGLFTGVYHDMRKHNCSRKGCWRIGRHPYVKDGVTHMLCKVDHPALRGKQHLQDDFLTHYQQHRPTEGN